MAGWSTSYLRMDLRRSVAVSRDQQALARKTCILAHLLSDNMLNYPLVLSLWPLLSALPASKSGTVHTPQKGIKNLL